MLLSAVCKVGHAAAGETVLAVFLLKIAPDNLPFSKKIGACITKLLLPRLLIYNNKIVGSDFQSRQRCL